MTAVRANTLAHRRRWSLRPLWTSAGCSTPEPPLDSNRRLPASDGPSRKFQRDQPLGFAHGSQRRLLQRRADDRRCAGADKIAADVVVMLTGRTLSTDPTQTADRAQLGAQNRLVFEQYADAIGNSSGSKPVVIVQSNPMEMGVQIFVDAVGRHRVIGAGAWSDTPRFRAELARSMQLRRTHVQAWTLGQLGDHLVPCRSQISAWGIPGDAVKTLQEQLRQQAGLQTFPERLRQQRAALLEHLQDKQWERANALIEACPPDLRTGLRPFLTHFTSGGHTTEVMTAHAVTDLVACLAEAKPQVFAAQVQLAGEWLDWHGVLGVPVLLGVNGWSQVCPLPLEPDEIKALLTAGQAIQNALKVAEG